MKNSLESTISNLNVNTISSTVSSTITHTHGGQLNNVAKQHNIPIAEWLDLSTGINPNNYPITEIPMAVWNRLPEENDDLNQIAAQHYNCDSLIAVAGSQVAIQLIPTLFSKMTVGLIQPGYYEHAKQWKKQQHTVVNFHCELNSKNNKSLLIEKINNKIHQLNALVIINPNNPSGLKFSKYQLQKWHTELAKNNGYLIVDEAFMDTNNSNSILTPELLPRLIVLRSVGKFFGLAGARIGFIFANDTILKNISELQGPWPISGPSRWLASKALADKEWQIKTQNTLKLNSARLVTLLKHYSLSPSGGTELFQWIPTDNAKVIYQRLLQQGILTRLFLEPLSLRFGIPKNESQWKKLELALKLL